MIAERRMQTAPHDSSSLDERAHRSPIVRRAVFTALALLLSVPFIFRGADLSLQSMFNAPLLWVKRDAESRQHFNEFLELFGAHEMVVVSWPGCQVDDQRLGKAADALERVRQERRGRQEGVVQPRPDRKHDAQVVNRGTG